MEIHLGKGPSAWGKPPGRPKKPVPDDVLSLLESIHHKPARIDLDDLTEDELMALDAEMDELRLAAARLGVGFRSAREDHYFYFEAYDKRKRNR